MAFAFTVDGVESKGNMKFVHGTFTSAAGDNTATLSSTTHGLDYIVDYKITLDTGGLDTGNPKVTISGGTLTAVWNDTEGYSGKFNVTGR